MARAGITLLPNEARRLAAYCDHLYEELLRLRQEVRVLSLLCGDGGHGGRLIRLRSLPPERSSEACIGDSFVLVDVLSDNSVLCRHALTSLPYIFPADCVEPE